MNSLAGVTLAKPIGADTGRQWEPLLLLLLACVIAIPYVNALDNGFVYDDERLIVSNETIHSPEKALAYFSRPNYILTWSTTPDTTAHSPG